MSAHRDGFVHLHVHTEYSSLDGHGQVVKVAQRAADLGQPAIAINDHGTLAGALAFDRACTEAGIKPIHGCEFYLSIGSRHERNRIEVPVDDVDADPDLDGSDAKKKTKFKNYEHITVVAISPTGWMNLIRLNNLAEDHFWRKPRIDLELLAEHREGLVVFTGCLGGPIASRLARGDMPGAKSLLGDMKDMFLGTGDPETSGLFVEVMSHGIGVEDNVVLPGLAQLARELGLPTIATNDAHYVAQEDAKYHDAFLCTQTRAKISDTNRFRFNGDGYFLKPGMQMRELFDDHPDLSGACDNTLLIAERVETGLMPATRLRIPPFPVPADYEPSEFAVRKGYSGSVAYLADLVRKGLLERYGKNASAEVYRRTAYEFDVIVSMGLADYFLLTWDIVKIAHDLDVRTGPGRGSAAGCLIAYLLGITQIDPVRNDLLFERFLNPERTSMPDIDVDFASSGVGLVRRKLVDRWGADRVAQVGTLGVMRSKAAIKAAGRVLGDESGKDADRMSKAIGIGGDGKPLPLAVVGDSLREQFGADHPVIEIAENFEGVKASPSIHASAQMVTPDPIGDEVPLRRDRRPEAGGMWVTQWDGVELDGLGFLKADILAVIIYDIIAAAIDKIGRRTGTNPEDIEAMIGQHPDDASGPMAQKTWDLIASGRTEGVFQLESPGMRRLCQNIAPSTFVDLAAIVALFRPGPLGANMPEHYAARKHGHEAVDYSMYVGNSPNAEAEAEAIEGVLGSTFGVFVFQEQAMRLGECVAGFDAVWRNRLQKAISKKNAELMASVGEAWMAGAIAPATLTDGTEKVIFDSGTASRLWDAIASSADYAFNASHSYSYAFVAWQTAFLKANWPADYAAALLEFTERDDKRSLLLAALRSDGVTIDLPSINLAGVHTACDDAGTKVVFGLSEIKDISKALAEAAVLDRSENGRFASVGDFVQRMGNYQVPCGPSQIIALAEAGAFDEFIESPQHRRGIAAAAPAIKQLCGWTADVRIPTGSWDSFETARREISRLQVLISQHPMSKCSETIRAWRSPESSGSQSAIPIGKLPLEDRYVVPAGMVTKVEIRTYGGGNMVKFTMEGSAGQVSGVAWDDVYQSHRDSDGLPQVGRVYAVPGKLQTSTWTSSSDDGEATIVTTRDVRASAFWPIPIPSDAMPDTVFSG